MLTLNKGDQLFTIRFGKGKVIETEGEGADKKAEVEFNTSGLKEYY